MSDTSTNKFIGYGTNAERLAFTPSPATIAAAPHQAYIWYATDTDNVYAYTTAWHQISSSSSGGAISALTGDVTATGPGSVAATIANNAVTTSKIATTAVTLARIANASANDKLLGSGNSGSGASYAEITLGSGLTMTGTTLSAGGSGGTVTTTGSPASGNLTKFSGAASVTNADLTGDVTTSGGVATTIANSAVTLAKIANAAASSKLVGSGASGSGAAYTEITLGTNLSMSGTTLNAAGSSGSAITTGTYASLPGTCAVGDMYVFTDSVYDFAVCRSANVWTYFLNGKIAAPPGVVSGWTGVNTGANWTATDSHGAILIQIARNASLNWRGLFKSQPSTPYTVTYYLRTMQQFANTQLTGVYFYDGTKLMGIEWLTQASGSSTIRVEKITNVTTDNSTLASYPQGIGAHPAFSSGVYAKLTNSGANLTFSISLDGITFYDIATEAIGTFITPTQYGFGGVCVSAAGDVVQMSMQSIVLA